MILNNQALEAKKRELEERERLYQASLRAFKEEEEAVEKYYNDGEQALAKSVELMFKDQPFKFLARLTEDRQHVEIWSSRSNILVGKYTKLPNNLFQNVGGTLAGLLRDEEILLSKMKEAIFKTMENCFK